MVYDCATVVLKDRGMTDYSKFLAIIVACIVVASCSATRYLKGGIHKEVDDSLTLVRLIDSPNQFLNKEIVFPVEYYGKGDLPCPLGEDYVNFTIADRGKGYISHKVWIKKDKAHVLDTLKINDIIVMKARFFKFDREKDPNLEALQIEPE